MGNISFHQHSQMQVQNFFGFGIIQKATILVNHMTGRVLMLT